MLEKWREKNRLDKAIDEVLSDMDGFTSDQDEYAKMVEHLETLHKLRQAEKPKPPQWDTVLVTVGNLVGIGVIVKYEQMNVIVSKGMDFLKKLK